MRQAVVVVTAVIVIVVILRVTVAVVIVIVREVVVVVTTVVVIVVTVRVAVVIEAELLFCCGCPYRYHSFIIYCSHPIALLRKTLLPSVLSKSHHPTSHSDHHCSLTQPSLAFNRIYRSFLLLLPSPLKRATLSSSPFFRL